MTEDSGPGDVLKEVMFHLRDIIEVSQLVLFPAHCKSSLTHLVFPNLSKELSIKEQEM